jgi:hypothetical protein
MTENSPYIPPSMRGKMRFANIFPCVNWAKKMLQIWDKLPSTVQEQVVFLKEKEGFITDLIQIEKIFKLVCKELKTKGFGKVQKSNILAELMTIEKQIDSELKQKTRIFIDNVKSYLDNLECKSKELNEEFILCSSNIIESHFGKFKAKVNTTSRACS